MRQVINAQFIIESDDEFDKENLRDNVCDALGHAPADITLLLEGDRRYQDPIARIMAVDDTLATELMLTAGLLWTCEAPCLWHNHENRLTCENCGAPKPSKKPELKVSAEAHTDDRKFEATFDATPWLFQASNDMLRDLANCGFGGDEPADRVARFFMDDEPSVTKIFRYLELRPRMNGPNSDEVGFECHVEAEQARGWIRANRPDLFESIWGEPA
jgi:hypothetical protein